MLRSNNKTYVCDVNGFSFVKSSDNYYKDCAYKIKRIIYDKLNLQCKENYLHNSEIQAIPNEGNDTMS
jgi:hypothetical protein